MISVTKLNGQVMVINAELIEIVEKTPDTIISLVTGKKYMVRESVEEIIVRVIEYRKQLPSFWQKIAEKIEE
ncbi:MAG: flagellar FlbD family protein [Candidatus Glassbacteria bacterium]